MTGSRHPVFTMLWWLRNAVQAGANGKDRLLHFCFEDTAVKIHNSGALRAQPSPCGNRIKSACFMGGTLSLLSLADAFLTLMKHFRKKYSPREPGKPKKKCCTGKGPGKLIVIVEDRQAAHRDELFMKRGGLFKGCKTGKMSTTDVPIAKLAFWVLGGGGIAGGFDYESMFVKRIFEDGKPMYAGQELMVWAQLAEHVEVNGNYSSLQKSVKVFHAEFKEKAAIIERLSEKHYAFINPREDGMFRLTKSAVVRGDKEEHNLLRKLSAVLEDPRSIEISNLGADDDEGVEASSWERNTLNDILASMGDLLQDPHRMYDESKTTRAVLDNANDGDVKQDIARDRGLFARGRAHVTGTTVEVTPDGACLFTAIAMGLQQLEGACEDPLTEERMPSHRNAAALRQLVCSTMQDKPQALVESNFPGIGTCAQFIMEEDVDMNDVDMDEDVVEALKVGHYLTEMKKKTTWGGALEISVLASVLKVCIKVCTEEETFSTSSKENTYCVAHYHNQASGLNTIHLRYVGALAGGNHYELLTNVEEMTDDMTNADGKLAWPIG